MVVNKKSWHYRLNQKYSPNQIYNNSCEYRNETLMNVFTFLIVFLFCEPLVIIFLFFLETVPNKFKKLFCSSITFKE